MCFDVIQRPLLGINDMAGLVVGPTRDTFIAASGEHIHYIPPIGQTTEDLDPAIFRISNTRLKGLAYVDDRLFTVSGGPKRTELIELL